MLELPSSGNKTLLWGLFIDPRIKNPFMSAVCWNGISCHSAGHLIIPSSSGKRELPANAEWMLALSQSGQDTSCVEAEASTGFLYANLSLPSLEAGSHRLTMETHS